jgi:amino acid transporter
MPKQNTAEGLKRVIGIKALATNIVNVTIGSGIYALPAVVAAQLGNASILAYLFCAAMLVTIMLCYAEIGSRVTTSGGSYIYVEQAFGPLAGYIVNWLFFIGWGGIASAAVMNVIADSLAVAFPIFVNAIPRAILFLTLLSVLTFINVRGTKDGVRMVSVLTFIKLVPLVGIMLLGFGYVRMENLRWEHFPPLKSLAETVLILFWSFAGFETSLNASGEIENPKHTIPRGILLGAAIIFIIYLVLQLVTQGILGSQILTYKAAPLAAVAERIIGPAGATILLVAAIVSCLGTVGGDALATPRLLFAGANDGLFPKPLGKVHPKFATPYVALITYSVLIFIFSISGGFRELAILASGSILLIYLGVVLATIKMRLNKDEAAEKMFKVPGGLIIPCIAVAAIIWLLSHLKAEEAIGTLMFIAGVCVFYLVTLLLQKRKVR